MPEVLRHEHLATKMVKYGRAKVGKVGRVCWRAIESPRDSYIRAMSNLERAKYKDSEGRIELVLVVPSGTRSTASGSTKRSEG